MNVLLLLFAFPIATIIYSIVLQKILQCPILVALTIFATFLILSFAVFDESFLIYTILYTIISYITAIVTRLTKGMWRRILKNQCNESIASSDIVNSNLSETSEFNYGIGFERNTNDTCNCRRFRR